jgi:hypothetical protein
MQAHQYPRVSSLQPNAATATADLWVTWRCFAPDRLRVLLFRRAGNQSTSEHATLWIVALGVSYLNTGVCLIQKPERDNVATRLLAAQT